jgi:hypothetical protein
MFLPATAFLELYTERWKGRNTHTVEDREGLKKDKTGLLLLEMGEADV